MPRQTLTKHHLYLAPAHRDLNPAGWCVLRACRQGALAEEVTALPLQSHPAPAETSGSVPHRFRGNVCAAGRVPRGTVKAEAIRAGGSGPAWGGCRRRSLGKCIGSPLLGAAFHSHRSGGRVLPWRLRLSPRRSWPLRCPRSTRSS